MKKFYYTDCKEAVLIIESDMFVFGPEPILWYNQGMYRLIPVALVANAIQLLDENEFGKPIIRFHWGCSVSIPQEIGDQLANKPFNHDAEQSKG